MINFIKLLAKISFLFIIMGSKLINSINLLVLIIVGDFQSSNGPNFFPFFGVILEVQAFVVTHQRKKRIIVK